MPVKPLESDNHLISREIIAFILDRRAAKLSPRTIEFYEAELGGFVRYLQGKEVTLVEQITADHIRQFLLELGTHRNPGGVHAAYRPIKTFLNWWAIECDDESWRNPIRKVKAPKLKNDPIPGISLEHLHSLLATCQKTRIGQRDRAILITLYDTGLRASEFLKLTFDDLNLKTGAIQVRSGKGNKDRTAYCGTRARREILRYLRSRPELTDKSPLWITQTGSPLTYAGLRQIIRRRADLAHIPTPEIHDFRRAFALNFLRQNGDVITLRNLMGHTTTKVLEKYVKLVEQDLKRGHELSSPGDNL